MHHVGIIGTGSYVPERILTNYDLEKMVETSDKWIFERTGIRERRIAAEEETNVTMGRLALERAIEEQFVKSGQYKTVAVVGSDKLSAITNYKDRNTCVLFGDGAGAVVLRRRATEGIIRSHLGGEYKLRDTLVLRNHGDDGRLFMWMNGNRVYAFAKGAMAESCLCVLDPDRTASKKELRALLHQVTGIVPHQANARIIKSAAEHLESKLDLPDGAVKNKMIVAIHTYGKHSTASLPLALDEAVREGKLRTGDLVILVGFGAGLTYGANLVRL